MTMRSHSLGFIGGCVATYGYSPLCTFIRVGSIFLLVWYIYKTRSFFGYPYRLGWLSVRGVEPLSISLSLPLDHTLILTMREPLAWNSRRTCRALRHTITGMLSDILHLSLVATFTQLLKRRVLYFHTHKRLHFGYPYSLGYMLIRVC